MNRFILFLLLLMGAFFLYNKLTKVGVTVVTEGDTVTVTAGNRKLVAEKRTEYDGSFLVVGGEAKSGVVYTPGFLSVIPLEEAEYLRSEYGNFMRCDNPGAERAKYSVINFLPIITDKKVLKDFKAVTTLVSGHAFRPVVGMKSVELNVLRSLVVHDGEEAEVPSGNMAHLIVSELQLESENFDME